jgi:GPH family glycoside/pentoside/hexuronide:cation symporter
MKETKSKDHREKPEERIKFSQLAAYGAGGIIPIALFNIAGILVGLMGNISLGLSAFWLGVILIIPRLWDALSDPVIGHLSDNTRTRLGRRRPYLLIGGILVAVFFVAMWWIPKGDGVRVRFATETGFQWFQLSYILFSLLLFFTACNIFEIPHGALGMEMTTDPHERTRLFSAKSFVGNLFAMSTPWLFALANMEIFRGPGGNEADGMRYVSLLIAAVLLPLSFWWFFTLREPGFQRAAEHEKTPFWKDMKRTVHNRNFVLLTLTIFTLAMGFNFVQLLGSYIPIFYVFGGDKVAGARLLGINGTIWAVTGLLAVFPLNWISPKIGKRNTLAAAILLMCMAQLSKIVCYNPLYPYLIIIPTVLLSAGMLFFFTLGSSMVGDICDEDELKTGYRAEGSYYSIFWWFIKMGTAFASFIGGALIVFTMFDEVQVTKVDRLQGSVRQLRGEVLFWMGDGSQEGGLQERIEKLKKRIPEAIGEAREYISYLERQSLEAQDSTAAAGHGPMKDAYANALSVMKSAATGLERLRPSPEDPEPSGMKELAVHAIPLILQVKIEKARVNSLELMSHLETRSRRTLNSKNHYDALLQNMMAVNGRLGGIDTAVSPDSLDNELGAAENEIRGLTRQSPYTLLMMRVVEIGLPFLLSVVSSLFLVRYSLTERRCREIKELLRLRNMERPIPQSAGRV